MTARRFWALHSVNPAGSRMVVPNVAGQEIPVVTRTSRPAVQTSRNTRALRRIRHISNRLYAYLRSRVRAIDAYSTEALAHAAPQWVGLPPPSRNVRT